jgi:hypothetical protein
MVINMLMDTVKKLINLNVENLIEKYGIGGILLNIVKKHLVRLILLAV